MENLHTAVVNIYIRQDAFLYVAMMKMWMSARFILKRYPVLSSKQKVATNNTSLWRMR